MTKKWRKIIAATLTLSILGSLTGCGGSKEADSDTIKVGVIQPRSGELAVSGEDSYVAQKIAIDQFNEAGGVDGKLIEAVVGDVPDPNNIFIFQTHRSSECTNKM